MPANERSPVQQQAYQKDKGGAPEYLGQKHLCARSLQAGHYKRKCIAHCKKEKGKKEAKPQIASRQLMISGVQVAEFKVKGRQIIFSPAKGNNPEDLIEQIKKALGAEE